VNLAYRFSRLLLPALVVLVLSACQLIPGSTVAPTANPSEVEPTPTAEATQIPPTATPTTEVETSTPEITQPAQEIVPLNFIRGLRVTLAHPWMNEAADKFETIITEFNTSNELGIEVIARRAGGEIALSDALIDGTFKDHLVLTRGFDLAGADDGNTWVNLSEAPGIEGITPEVQTCSTCADYLDQAHQDRYITLLYQPALLYYNQTWARELGFEVPPRTLQELLEQLQAAATSKINDGDFDNNGTGGLWTSITPQSTLAWYRVFGGGFLPEDDLPVFGRDPMVESFNLLKNLRGSGLSWQPLKPTAYEDFVKRSALAYEGTLSDMMSQEIAFEVSQSNDEWITLPYPTADGNGSISMETMSISIASSYDRAEASSAYFVRWLLQPEQLKKLAEVTGLWPVQGNPEQIAPEFAEAHPGWASALSPTVRLTLAPETKNWGISRLILQDATLRLYSLDAEFIPTILDTLDATLIEAGASQ